MSKFETVNLGWRHAVESWSGLCLVMLGVAVVGVSSAAAAPGDLDRRFDRDGIAILETDTADESRSLCGRDVAIQADGKIVALGSGNDIFGVVRYKTNGRLDSRFGQDGIAATPFQDSAPNAVAIQPNGKIVVVGTTESFIVVVRYRHNGDLDPKFSGDGVVIAPFPDTEVSAVALQANGKIVVVGSVKDANRNDAFAVVRYRNNGVLDTFFGSNGIAITQASNPASRFPNSRARAIAIQADGKSVVVGLVIDADDNPAFGVVRYLTNGQLDPAFGEGGIAIIQVRNPVSQFPSSFAKTLAIQADGKILVAGSSSPTEEFGAPGLVRLQVNGQLDTSFGQDGVVIIPNEPPLPTNPGPLGITLFQINEIVLQSDGRIVAVIEGTKGFILNESVETSAIVRFETGGQLDPTFGRSGIVDLDLDPGEMRRATRANSIAIQTDGKIVAAGSVNNGGDRRGLVVFRFEGGTTSKVSCDCGSSSAIVGSDGSETLVGTYGADIICGFGGNDRLIGKGGNDCLDGGSGDDSLFGDSGKDLLIARDGNDELNGGSGDDILRGDRGNDTLNGDGGNDVLHGFGGMDVLNGGDGDDELRGGNEDDELFGGRGEDSLRGGGGQDTCSGGPGKDSTHSCYSSSQMN